MIPLALRLRNFRSFKAEQTFHFPQKPGLYFMKGLNEAEPRLGANGAGKTTIWDALTWCIHGVTADGLKAGDVCNWHASGDVMVAFDFIFDDQPDCIWTLTRTWGPISWRLSHVAEFVTDEEVIDLTKDKTNPVLAWLRLELDPWLSCVLTAQGQPMFLDLKADAQANLFSSVMNLDRWLDYSKKASAQAGAQDGVSRSLERKVSELRGRLDAMGDQNFTASSKSWAAEQDRRLRALDEEHAAAMQRLERAKAKKQEAEIVGEEARAGLREWLAGNDRAGIEHDYRKHWKPMVSDYSDLLSRAEADLEHLLRDMEHFAKNEACPTCGVALSARDAAEQISKLHRKQERLDKEVKKWRRELEGARQKVADTDAILAGMDEAEGKLRDLVEGAEQQVSAARRELELVERELDRIEDRAEEIEREKDPYAEMARQAATMAQTLANDLRDAQGALDASSARYGLLSYWVKGFKEVRLQQIAEALTELEIEVNSAVTSLGLVDWELRFAVDKEGKGGGIQRGFSVMVKSPHNPTPTPWKAWSGGEKQRLRLAGNMGLADLIRSRTGTPINLEVWDEPTNGLSPEGWKDLLESLAARAHAEQRIVFITDHKAHDFGGFAGQYTVIKRPSGSKVVIGGEAV